MKPGRGRSTKNLAASGPSNEVNVVHNLIKTLF